MDVYFPVPLKRASFSNKDTMTLKSFNVSGQSKFTLGKLCKEGHSALNSDRESVGMTIRYKSCGSCVECIRKKDKRSQYASRDQVGKKELEAARARAKIEDMKIAKDIGLTLQEYYS